MRMFLILPSANACGIDYTALNFTAQPVITDTITIPQRRIGN